MPRNTKVKHLGPVQQLFGNARVREIGHNRVNKALRHKIKDGVLYVSLGAVNPFSMDGIELRLYRLSNSSYKDGQYGFSLGARELEHDQVALS